MSQSHITTAPIFVTTTDGEIRPATRYTRDYTTKTIEAADLKVGHILAGSIFVVYVRDITVDGVFADAVGVDESGTEHVVSFDLRGKLNVVLSRNV